MSAAVSQENQPRAKGAVAEGSGGRKEIGTLDFELKYRVANQIVNEAFCLNLCDAES